MRVFFIDIKLLNNLFASCATLIRQLLEEIVSFVVHKDKGREIFGANSLLLNAIEYHT